MNLNDEGLIELEAPSAERLDKVIPGSKWSTSRKLWLLPLSWAACTVAREVLGDALEIGPDLTSWAREEYESRVLPATVARESEDGPRWSPADPGDPNDVVERLEGVPEERESNAIDTVEKAEGAWWADIWRGMPEFLNRDLMANRKLIVNFRSDADVEEFSKLIGQRIGPRVPSVWYPEAEIVHEIDWLYSDEEDHSVPESRPSHLRRAGKPAAKKASDPLSRVLEGLL